MALVVNECRRNSYRQKKSKIVQSVVDIFVFSVGWLGMPGTTNVKKVKKLSIPMIFSNFDGKVAEKMIWAICPSCGHCVNVTPKDQSHTIDCRF